MMNFLRILFGYRYKINYNSKEIHDIKNTHKNCHINSLTQYEYCGKKHAHQLINYHDFNGCRWCYKKFDRG